jgi:hypothetical protein
LVTRRATRPAQRPLTTSDDQRRDELRSARRALGLPARAGTRGSNRLHGISIIFFLSRGDIIRDEWHNHDYGLLFQRPRSLSRFDARTAQRQHSRRKNNANEHNHPPDVLMLRSRLKNVHLLNAYSWDISRLRRKKKLFHMIKSDLLLDLSSFEKLGQEK